MACKKHLSFNKRCNQCCSTKGGCTDEQLAYLASVEWVDKILANLQINELTTNDKTLVGALIEFDKMLEHKLDKTPATEYLATKSVDDLRNLFGDKA